MDAIQASREYLESQIEPKVAQKKELQNQIEEIDKEIAPIEAALSALKNGKSAKKSPKKSDVQSVLRSLANDNPGIEAQTLESLAKQKLQEQGFNLRNFTNLAKGFEPKPAA